MDKSLLKEKRIHGDAMFPMEVYVMHYSHPNSSLDSHWHDELELLLITEGTAIFQIETSSYKVSKGQALFINSGELHAGFGAKSEPWGYFAVVFHPSLLQGNSYDRVTSKYVEPLIKKKYLLPHFIEGANEWQNNLLTTLTKMIETYNNKQFAYELKVKSYLYNILSEILCHSEPRVADREFSNQLYKTERFKKILSYIQHHYNHKICLSELAAEVNMSEGHFCRFFKQMSKKTPVDYINFYKISKAAKLLEESDMRIIDAAMEVGFDNFSYFINIFKHYMNCTPSEYRKKENPTSLNL